MSFQGLTVNLASGPIPWFEAALCCLSPADRQVVYAAKRAENDTHALVFMTAGVPLYPEANQPYVAYQCPNYEADPAAFVALVEEVIQAGFVPCVFFQEDQPVSTRLLPIAIAALKASAKRDLNADVLLVPGFDGVWYGWLAADIIAWGRLAAQFAPNGYRAIEHNTAHLPLGNGPADWAPGGPLDAFDVVLSEFDPWAAGTPAGDAVWQIAARLLGPAYVRPIDQPRADDPSPPFYLGLSSRGPRVAVAFEYATYWFVRGQALTDTLRMRTYFKGLGYSCVC